jgi:hypothetical protein
MKPQLIPINPTPQEQLIKILNLDPSATYRDIVGAASAMAAALTDLKARKASADEFEIAVGLRIRASLTRDQAIAAEKRQREFDAQKKANRSGAGIGSANPS